MEDELELSTTARGSGAASHCCMPTKIGQLHAGARGPRGESSGPLQIASAYMTIFLRFDGCVGPSFG